MMQPKGSCRGWDIWALLAGCGREAYISASGLGVQEVRPGQGVLWWREWWPGLASGGWWGVDTPTSSNQQSLSQHTPPPPPSALELQRVLTSAQWHVTSNPQNLWRTSQGDRDTVGLVTYHVMGVKICTIYIFRCLKYFFVLYLFLCFH